MNYAVNVKDYILVGKGQSMGPLFIIAAHAKFAKIWRNTLS